MVLGKLGTEQMKLSDYFHRIVCINLDRRVDRWKECLIEMASNNMEGVERFSGYDHPTHGHTGCTRSHRILLRQIAEGDAKRVLVLEDDFASVTRSRLALAGFRPEQQVWKDQISVLDGQGDLNQRFNSLIPFIPEFDVLYLGGGYAENPISRLNSHVIRCAGMKTTSSYGITKEFAKVWSDRVNVMAGSEDLDRHPGCVDDCFSAMSRDNRFYILQPRLIFQRLSPSDITGETNSHLYSMTDVLHQSRV